MTCSISTSLTPCRHIFRVTSVLTSATVVQVQTGQPEEWLDVNTRQAEVFDLPTRGGGGERRADEIGGSGRIDDSETWSRPRIRPLLEAGRRSVRQAAVVRFRRHLHEPYMPRSRLRPPRHGALPERSSPFRRCSSRDQSRVGTVEIWRVGPQTMPPTKHQWTWRFKARGMGPRSLASQFGQRCRSRSPPTPCLGNRAASRYWTEGGQSSTVGQPER